MSEIQLGENVQGTLEGDELTLKINLAERLGRSASGKTMVIATTRGNQPIGLTGAKIGLNIYTK